MPAETARPSAPRWGLCLVTCVCLLAGLGGCPRPPDRPAPSVARLWDEAMLRAIQLDTGRSTVPARILFHTSIAMYDA